MHNKNTVFQINKPTLSEHTNHKQKNASKRKQLRRKPRLRLDGTTPLVGRPGAGQPPSARPAAGEAAQNEAGDVGERGQAVDAAR